MFYTEIVILSLAVSGLLMGKSMVLAGYLPAWGYDSVPESSWSRLTHVNYFSIQPNADGSLDRSDVSSENLKSLREKSEKYGFQVLICIGGWERSAHFAKISADSKLRGKFVKSVLSFIDEFGLSGVDMDWEHPEGSEQVQNCGLLLRDLRKGLGSDRLLTAAIASWQEVPLEAVKALDWVNLMSYDHPKQHASFAASVNDVKLMKEKGFSADKIVLGVPFYGRDITNYSDAKTNRQLEAAFHPPLNSDMVENYYRNGSSTLAKKAGYVKDRGLRGAMVWEISQDRTDGVFLEILESALKKAED